MIRREWNGQLLLISQPAHAQLAGKLAAQWGNEEFLPPQPRLEVILATSQHDDGWEEWEDAPQLNPQKGLPYHFTEMPVSEHLTIWRRGVERMRKQNAYAALLVSLHGAALYSYGLDPARDSPEAQEQVREFLDEQRTIQQQLQSELDPSHAPRVPLNFRLLQVWDWMSLLLCCHPLTERTIPQVPRHEDPASWQAMKLLPLSENALTFAPYPFRVPQFRVTVSGRLLPLRTFETQDAFSAAFRAAPHQQLTFEVVSGGE